MVDYNLNTEKKSLTGEVNEIKDSIILLDIFHELSDDLTPNDLAALRKLADRCKNHLQTVLVSSSFDGASISYRYYSGNTIILAGVFLDDDEFECSIGEFDLNTGKCVRSNTNGILYLP